VAEEGSGGHGHQIAKPMKIFDILFK